VAEAYGFELPEAGIVGMKLTELPSAFVASSDGPVPATALLVRRVTQSAVVRALGRVTRWLPGLGAGFGGWRARRQMRQMGERMADVFRRAAGPSIPPEDQIEDAVEVR
jgi:hypothetical protein